MFNQLFATLLGPVCLSHLVAGAQLPFQVPLGSSNSNLNVNTQFENHNNEPGMYDSIGFNPVIGVAA